MDLKTKYILAELEDKIVDTVTSYINKNVPRPFGLLLSGGFDSGLLAALTKPDYCYRIKFPYGNLFDESRYADAVANHLGLNITEVEINPKHFKINFKKAIKVMGETTTHFSLVPFYTLMGIIQQWRWKEFKEKKIHILSGEGPDEYLGGYARYLMFDHLNKLYKIPELRNYHEFINKFFEKIVEEIPPQGLGKDILGLIGEYDMKHGQIEIMEQKMANHFGVRLHYPYIDNKLAEYCYALPDDIKIRNRQTKWAFRQICKKYLPEIMWDRAKMGGPVAPVNKWMGWETEMGNFGKEKYLELQRTILGE